MQTEIFKKYVFTNNNVKDIYRLIQTIINRDKDKFRGLFSIGKKKVKIK